jgi:hypothetical protein
LDLEIAELLCLIRWKPTTAHLAEERDWWLLQCFSRRRYEDLEKLEYKACYVLMTKFGAWQSRAPTPAM